MTPRRQNYASLDVTQYEQEHRLGCRRRVPSMPLGVGAGFVYQSNSASQRPEDNTALANTGANVQGTLGPGQPDPAGLGSRSPVAASAISLGVVAGAVGGDATALPANKAWSSNSQKVHNEATTGCCGCPNVTVLDLEQGNVNGGDGHHDGDDRPVSPLAVVGVGVGVIIQTNYAGRRWLQHSRSPTPVRTPSSAARRSTSRVSSRSPERRVAGRSVSRLARRRCVRWRRRCWLRRTTATSTNWQQVLQRPDHWRRRPRSTACWYGQAERTRTMATPRRSCSAEVPLVYAGAISQSNSYSSVEARREHGHRQQRCQPRRSPVRRPT